MTSAVEKNQMSNKQELSFEDMQKVNGGSGLLIFGVIGAIGAFIAGGLALATVAGIAIAARHRHHRHHHWHC